MLNRSRALFDSLIKMKILTYITSIDLSSGGPSRSVPMLVKGLAELGADVTLMTQRSDNMNIHALDGTTAKLRILDGFKSEEVETFIRNEKFHIVQMQSMWDLRYHKLAKICRKLNIPYVETPRGMLEPWSLAQKKWKKRLALWLYQMSDLNHAACIYTTAEDEARNVKALGVKAPCVVIPNGIEVDSYKCRTSIDVVKKQVLFLSRIHLKKGIELLIEAWTRIVNDFPDWKLMIVGNGETAYIESLRTMAERLGVGESVTISEPVFGEAKVRLYQSSALFVLPSYSENFGMVIAEAMSCGVPVITTKYCPWEILNETNTGWWIDLSVDKLSDCLRNAMCMDLSKLFDMGQRASKLVHEKFDYRNVAKKTLRLYKSIVD